MLGNLFWRVNKRLTWSTGNLCSTEKSSRVSWGRLIPERRRCWGHHACGRTTGPLSLEASARQVRPGERVLGAHLRIGHIVTSGPRFRTGWLAGLPDVSCCPAGEVGTLALGGGHRRAQSGPGCSLGSICRLGGGGALTSHAKMQRELGRDPMWMSLTLDKMPEQALLQVANPT